MRFAALRAELPRLLKLAAPLIVGELGWMAMSVVDTAMLGRAPGAALALAASALAQVLFNTLAFAAGGVLLALDTLFSQAMGEGDRAAANRWMLDGLWLATGLAALLMLGVFGLPALLWHLPVDRRVLQAAVPALQGLNYGVLPLLLYFALRRYLQAAQHGRLIMAALVSANVVNAAGDWLLIFGHRWAVAWGARETVLRVPALGVVGSAWATSAARVYLAVFVGVALWWVDRRHGYGLRSTVWRLEAGRFRRMLRLGTPMGAQIFVEVAIFAVTTATIATFGPVPLAGHEIALQAASTVFMVPLAISGATTVRVGRAIGRARAGVGGVDEITAAGWSGILAGAGFMLGAACVFWSVPARLARVFAADPAVVTAAVPLLVVAACFQFFDGVQSTATGALRGTGRTVAPLVIQMICFWAVGMPLGLVFALPWHGRAEGMWWGLAVGISTAAVALVWQWHRVSRDAAALVQESDRVRVAAPM